MGVESRVTAEVDNMLGDVLQTQDPSKIARERRVNVTVARWNVRRWSAVGLSHPTVATIAW